MLWDSSGVQISDQTTTKVVGNCEVHILGTAIREDGQAFTWQAFAKSTGYWIRVTKWSNDNSITVDRTATYNLPLEVAKAVRDF